MINALKLVSVHRGHDPRDFACSSAAAAAAMHGAALGAELGAR